MDQQSSLNCATDVTYLPWDSIHPVSASDWIVQVTWRILHHISIPSHVFLLTPKKSSRTNPLKAEERWFQRGTQTGTVFDTIPIVLFFFNIFCVLVGEASSLFFPLEAILVISIQMKVVNYLREAYPCELYHCERRGEERSLGNLNCFIATQKKLCSKSNKEKVTRLWRLIPVSFRVRSWVVNHWGEQRRSARPLTYSISLNWSPSACICEGVGWGAPSICCSCVGQFKQRAKVRRGEATFWYVHLLILSFPRFCDSTTRFCSETETF